MKILVICPSIRPEKLAIMSESLGLTKSRYTDFTFSMEGNVTEAINGMFNSHPDYDFYHVTNDDVIYKTKFWDIELAQKGKITHGKDAIKGGLNGNFLMIDGDIARAVGWLQLPTLNKYGGDVVWKFMGQRLNILEYMPSVIIEHNWEGASEADNKSDMNKFAEWLPHSEKDIHKIRKALNVRI